MEGAVTSAARCCVLCDMTSSRERLVSWILWQMEAQRLGAEVDRLNELLSRRGEEAHARDAQLTSANAVIATLQAELEKSIVSFAVVQVLTGN